MEALTDITVKSLLYCLESRGSHFVEIGLPIYQISSSISMVPNGLRDLSPSSFNPRVVSIGPLHREDKNLKAFKRQKATFTYDLLRALHTDMKELLTECVQKVALSIYKIRGSYARSIPYDDSELAQMMIVDACFILQALRTLRFSEDLVDFFACPSIIFYDLVLIENQIPFFILKKIFNSTIMRYECTTSLTDYILKLVNHMKVFETDMIVSDIPIHDHDHILAFIEKCCWAPKDYSLSPGLPSSEIHSTVELDRAGVIFKPNPDERWPMAMEFKSSTLACCSWLWSTPTLQMPVLRIHSFTELILRNLVAYEYTYVSPGFVTSYATTMDMLVNTQDGISILIESKVVVNHLGSNGKSANMINSLRKELPLQYFYYAEQWKQLDTHYNSYWPRNITSLKRTYFSSPWNSIALFAGIVLFALSHLPLYRPSLPFSAKLALT